MVPISEVHKRFRISFDNIDSFSQPDYTPEAIDIILNDTQNDFMNLITNLGIEETQTNTDYLANLVKADKITTFTPGDKPNGYYANLPLDYRKMLSEEAQVKYPDCKKVNTGEIELGVQYIVTSGSITYNSILVKEGEIFTGTNTKIFIGSGTVNKVLLKRVPVKPETRDRYSKVIQNPFKVPYEDQLIRLEYSKSSTAGPQVYEVVSSKNVVLNEYYINYYKNPVKMQYGSKYATPIADVDCELNDEAVNQIIERAVTKAKKIISQEYQIFHQSEQENIVR